MELVAYMRFSDHVIIQTLKKLEADKRQVTCRQILEAMDVSCSHMTLYRFINRMEKLGKLRRFDYLPKRGSKYELKLD